MVNEASKRGRNGVKRVQFGYGFYELKTDNSLCCPWLRFEQKSFSGYASASVRSSPIRVHLSLTGDFDLPSAAAQL
jgi:hypothetical protein